MPVKNHEFDYRHAIVPGLLRKPLPARLSEND